MAVADATINIVAHDKTQKAFKSVDNNLNRTSDALKGLAKRFIFAAGAAGIGGFVKQTINAADRLDKLSKRLDIGVSALSEYEHVANIGGVTFETLTMGMQRLTRRVAEAAGGFGEAKGALRELGLDASELNKLPLDQKFEVVADALMGLTSESDRVRLAMKLFDSEGVALIQTMQGGAEGIKKVRDEARQLGLTISKETATAAANFNDEMTNLTGAIQGLANEALPTLLPLLTDTVDALKGGIQFIKDWATEIKFVALAAAELYLLRTITTLIAGFRAVVATTTITVRGLGVALSGMLGGIPGILSIAATAFLMFKDDVDKTTESISEQEQAISKLRNEINALELDELEKLQIDLSKSIADTTEEIDFLTEALEEVEKNAQGAREAMQGHQGSLEDTIKAAAGLQTAIVESEKAFEDQNSVVAVANTELLEHQENLEKLKKQLEIVKERIKELTTEQKSGTETLTDYDKELASFVDSLKKAQVQTDTLAEKNMLLDEMFHNGSITAETYYEQIDKLNGSLYKADEASTELAESTDTLKESIEGFIDGVKGSWETMWSDLFTGKSTIKTFKDFIDTIETMFLQMLAKIAAQATWDAIFGKLIPGAGGGGGLDIGSIISGIFSKIFTGGGGEKGGITSAISSAISTITGGATGGTAAGGIGSSIMSGLGSIGTAIKGVFSSITSSITGAGTAAGSGFVSSVGSALSAGAGILGPLAIAAFGFAKISKKKKELKAEFKSLMSDNAITSRLTTEKLVGDYNVLGEHGGRTYVQIGATAAKMYEGIGMWSGKAFGLQRFAMQEMKDEFGNVIIRANNFNELMSILERQEPFVKQAQDLLDLHGPSIIAKEGIELVNSELVRADQAFAQMGQSGVNALMAVNTKSNQYEQIMQRGFVTATQMAQMGLEGFGQMSADVFDIIVRGVQDSEGAMNSLAEAAQIAIDKGRQAASLGGGGGGLQHGGSFIVGGGGGTDSQRVSFMATPGERVTVETPNQQRASGSDGGNVVKELRALRADLANVVAKPIVGAVSRGQLAMAGMGRH